jgi:hypothetical protein
MTLTLTSLDRAILLGGTVYMTSLSLTQLNYYLMFDTNEIKKNIFISLNFSIVFGGSVLLVSNYLCMRKLIN